ncbi:MAG: hypothetical protein IKH33_02480 [Bacteroidales bacterium]|nr:hypothetical protein [Bacteroidales bacterium]
MKRLTLLILLLTVLGVTASAQDTLLSTQTTRYKFQLDSTTIMLGDQTVLAIEPSAIYPSLEDLTNNDIVAVNQWIDSTNGNFCTTLTSFEEGEHWLHVGMDSVLITVKDVPNVDTTNTNIRDIANILRQPYTFGEIAKVVGIVLGILALVAAIIFIVIRIKQHKPIITIPQAPPLPADVRALDALETLRQQQLWQQGRVKEYHTQLTDIVRNYLEETYSIPSTEMTSDQTLDAFHSCSAYTEEASSQLQQMLQTADMVKFAKSQPQPYQHDLSMTQAVNFVKLTAPKHEEHPADTEQPKSTQEE